MGGLLHLFDFNQSRMARKILAHKRHIGGKYYGLTHLTCGEKGAIFSEIKRGFQIETLN